MLLYLDDEKEAALRLACQIRPRSDLTVEIINPAAPSGWAAPAVSQDWSRAGGSPLGRQDSGTGALSLGSERVDCTVRVGGARVGADQARRVVPCSERRDGPRQRSLAQQSVAADGRRSSPAFAGSLHRPRLNADVGSLQFARCPHSR